MTDAPRTLLNRLLLTAIAFMTVAIFALAGAIIWQLFLREDDDTPPPLTVGETPAAQTRTLVSGSASVSYTLPPDCVDQVTTADNAIALVFEGPGCAAREIQAIAGDVTIEVN